MEIREKIDQAKERRKSYVQSLSDEKRLMLKMYTRAKKSAKVALYGILVLFIVLAIAYLILSLAAPYQNNWVVNAIVFGVLFVIGAALLLWKRHSDNKKANAFSAVLSDFTNEYDEMTDRLGGLEKAEKDRVAAERKAARAEEKARAAEERAAAKVREAEERAKAIQEQAKAEAEAAAAALQDAHQRANTLAPDAEPAAPIAESVAAPAAEPEPVVPVFEPVEEAPAFTPVPVEEAPAFVPEPVAEAAEEAAAVLEQAAECTESAAEQVAETAEAAAAVFEEATIPEPEQIPAE